MLRRGGRSWTCPASPRSPTQRLVPRDVAGGVRWVPSSRGPTRTVAPRGPSRRTRGGVPTHERSRLALGSLAALKAVYTLPPSRFSVRVQFQVRFIVQGSVFKVRTGALGKVV